MCAFNCTEWDTCSSLYLSLLPGFASWRPNWPATAFYRRCLDLLWQLSRRPSDLALDCRSRSFASDMSDRPYVDVAAVVVAVDTADKATVACRSCTDLFYLIKKKTKLTQIKMSNLIPMINFLIALQVQWKFNFFDLWIIVYIYMI